MRKNRCRASAFQSEAVDFMRKMAHNYSRNAHRFASLRTIGELGHRGSPRLAHRQADLGYPYLTQKEGKPLVSVAESTPKLLNRGPTSVSNADTHTNQPKQCVTYLLELTVYCLSVDACPYRDLAILVRLQLPWWWVQSPLELL